MKRKVFFLIALVVLGVIKLSAQNKPVINLAGTWMFRIDSLDVGISEGWAKEKFSDSVQLPGSMTTNGKGNEVDIHTPWTATINNKSWFSAPEYASYRVPGNIKIPFWLQPVKYYKGPAWYSKTISIPLAMQGKSLELYLERCHWQTTLWVDGQLMGTRNSLSTPHVYRIAGLKSQTKHLITIRVDNRVGEINVGPDSHSVTDHTQTNWNGIIGELSLKPEPVVQLKDIAIYPDIIKKNIRVSVRMENHLQSKTPVMLVLQARGLAGSEVAISAMSRTITADTGISVVELVYKMQEKVLLWDEFHPNLYSLTVALQRNKKTISQSIETFGMRDFAARGTQFTINGKPTFLRGTLECAIFPKTGYPPVDSASWNRIFRICRSYGLNHLRFHSWCPPEAAFRAADEAGFYLQIECASWANSGATVGDGKPLDSFLYDESDRIVKAYGNHPSFCMMVYGNEPAGKNHVKYLTDFVGFWKKKDARRLYTTGAGWPVEEGSDYNSSPDPRIQRWGEELKSIINSKTPSTDFDWSDIISKWKQPTVSHEIGQWCVYPDFKEIQKYNGVLKAKNFEIFQEKLEKNGMKNLADSFLLASGKLQALCYKADIEAALRTPGFAGFQLLDLHDFPGQGTALVGVLNPFWEDKGYITAAEYSRFCNSVVPLARLSKLVYNNNEEFVADVQIANFGDGDPGDQVSWEIRDSGGRQIFSGNLDKSVIAPGNNSRPGTIKQSLSSITTAGMYSFSLKLGKYENSWTIFIYPATLTKIESDIYVTQTFDSTAQRILSSGGKVLYTLKKGALRDTMGESKKLGFSSIFWNTAWTNGQAPVTLGILCNPAHEAFREFPTEYFSNYQWQDAMRHGSAINIDSVSKGMQPILRVIDDWVTARPLGLLLECKVGKGRLMLSGIDLESDLGVRPEARQLRYSLLKYMSGTHFNPAVVVEPSAIMRLTSN